MPRKMGAKPDLLLKAGARVRLLKVAKEAEIKKKPINSYLKLWSVTSCKPRKAGRYEQPNSDWIYDLPNVKTGLRK